MGSTGAEERRFPIMGSHGHVVVVGGPAGLADRAVTRLAELEARWTRFRPTSELCRLNRSGGAPLLVSADTVLLVDTLREGWVLTGGRFDPTVHDTMVDLGYATSWPEVAPPIRLPAPRVARGCLGVEVDHRLADHRQGLVQLPDGVHLDPGGLGKGLAADLVATELMAAGAEGALVNVGGDLRVVGRPARAPGWRIDVEHPDDEGRELARVEIADGGVATSTSARRRWTTSDGDSVHHIIDPATGRPADRSWTQATVVAGCAWWAEVLATVAYLDGELADPCAGALLVDDHGSTHVLGDRSWFSPTVATGMAS